MIEKEKQIEEMENDLRECHTEFYSNAELYTDYNETAKGMFAKGYRKQSVGEWTRKQSVYYCSNCGKGLAIRYGERPAKSYNFCPNCGAKMKGGE